LKSQELKYEELAETMDLLCGIANNDEDFKEEWEGKSITYQFDVTDLPQDQWMFLKIDKGHFSYGKGKAPAANLTFSMNKILAGDMVSGKVDSNSAFLAGNLKIAGKIGDGVRFQKILALMKDKLDI
jgi:putative sterol carrier protein